MSDFSVSVNDNDSFMCSSEDEIFDNMDDLAVCEKCHYRTDFEFINSDFKLKLKTYDLSATYDGYYIASLKFKESLAREKISGIEFVPIKNEPKFFAMFVHCIVAFDTVKRQSHAENLCPTCGNFESFVGATPAFLKEPLSNELCRSDVTFGSGYGKSPLLLVSEKFIALTKREKLKGIYFEQTRT